MPEGRMSGWDARPDYRIEFEPSPRRVRVEFDGQIVADSTRVMLMLEEGYLPVYYFPEDDVRQELLTPSDRSTHCPFKGDARYWTVEGPSGRRAENAVWAYDEPFDEMAAIARYRAFAWDAMDHWYEEDEEVFVHARDPYKRVDVIDSRRHVRVMLGGEVVADTRQARFLFETGLPTRYYVPRANVRTDLLTPTDSRTRCPYKGEAVYWSATVDGKTWQDIVWSYPEPIAECPRIKDLMCFYDENVDAVLVDGVEQPRPRTKWSRDRD